jgi:hypothetical protein
MMSGRISQRRRMRAIVLPSAATEHHVRNHVRSRALLRPRPAFRSPHLDASTHSRDGRGRVFHRAIAIAIGLVLTGSSLALAQSDPAPAGTASPPAREGNIYDHKDHQPTRAEVGDARRDAGIEPTPSDTTPSETTREVEDEVHKLLQQTDKLDKQFKPPEYAPPR